MTPAGRLLTLFMTFLTSKKLFSNSDRVL